jgi:hypothetical protein
LGVIGKSEEKLRPRSAFWRRVLARYVSWVELAGYLLVFALIAGLVAASQIKAEDEFLAIPGEVRLQVKVLRARGDAAVRAIVRSPAAPGGDSRVSQVFYELETAPGRVARASLMRSLEEQRKFARERKQDAVAANVQAMMDRVGGEDGGPSDVRRIAAHSGGAWRLTDLVRVGDVVTSGAVLAVDLNVAGTKVAIDTKSPSVSQKGNKLRAGQPATVTLSLNGAPVSLLGRVVQGGKKNPQVELTDVRPEDMAKIVDFFKAQPDHDGTFAGANVNVLVGEKSWASLIWK